MRFLLLLLAVVVSVFCALMYKTKRDDGKEWVFGGIMFGFFLVAFVMAPLYHQGLLPDWATILIPILYLLLMTRFL